MKINRLSGGVSDLYFISTKSDLSGDFIKPGIPNNLLTRGRFEDSSIPRVKLYGSVSDAISGQFIGQRFEPGTRLFVYKPTGINLNNLLETSLTTTPYCLLVDEKWYTLPLRVERIGEIEICSLDKEEEYRFGTRLNIGRLYRWAWREIKKPWERSKL